jgi:diphthine synthase
VHELALYIVGAGVSAEYLTLRALKALARASKIYIDTYTSIAPGIDEELFARLAPEAEIVKATRFHLEDEAYRIIEEASRGDVAILVPGDPLTATTHVAIAVEARKRGIDVVVVPGVSGIQAVIDQTGLQIYRFGRTVTLVYPEEGVKPYTTLEVIRDNRLRGLHTLVLLDLRLDAGRAMTIPEAVEIMLSLEKEMLAKGILEEGFLEDSLLVAVARAGLRDSKCVAGKPVEVAAAEYPPPPHSIVVTAPKLHPVEEEAISVFCQNPRQDNME